MVYALIALAVGLLLWILPLPPKAQEAGRIGFAIGLFFVVWLLTQRGGYTLRI